MWPWRSGWDAFWGETVEFHWCANADCAWHCLPAGRCDMVVGLPHESGPPRTAAWSVPYAGAQFGLVVPRGSARRRIPGRPPRQTGRYRDRHGCRSPRRTTRWLASNRASSCWKGSRPRRWTVLFWTPTSPPGICMDILELGLKLVPEYCAARALEHGPGSAGQGYTASGRDQPGPRPARRDGRAEKDLRRLGVPFRPPVHGDDPRKASLDTWQRIRERGELVVSMDPANLPYSGAKGEHPGFDVELARALAERLDVKLRIDWLDIQHETAIGQLLEHECDLVFGEAVAANAVADDEELAGKVLYSRPYYGTGYVLVERKNGPHVRSLAELKGAKSQRLGTEAGSVADYSLRQRGYLRRLFRNQLATLKALNDGDIDYAYLWANVGWTLHVSPDLNLKLVPDYVPEDHWNIAVAMCRGDDELKRHVDAALDALIKDGTVARIMAGYHVPYYRPVSGAGPAMSRRCSAQPIHHGVADRGPEPRMQKDPDVQTRVIPGWRGSAPPASLSWRWIRTTFPSRRPIPSRPGSTMQLLACSPGNWVCGFASTGPISAHDSYPVETVVQEALRRDSGRHARRSVRAPGSLFPALLSTRGINWSSGPVKVRPRRKSLWPSSKGLPSVVLDGRSRAVVSQHRGDSGSRCQRAGKGRLCDLDTRPLAGPERWPGKLSFSPRHANPSDCFPICAAVRKTDGDLKDAIDRAWDELDRSGQLAEVFARWHIPYDPGAAAETRKEPGP